MRKSLKKKHLARLDIFRPRPFANARRGSQRNSAAALNELGVAILPILANANAFLEFE